MENICAYLSSRRPRQSGFTLIELMITVAIIAILASIAMPAYQEYVKRGYRASAESEMMDLANRQQQFFLANRVYAGTTTALNYPAVPNELNGRYTAGMAADNTATPPTFTITFTAIGAQASDGNLTLTGTGVKQCAGDSSKW